MYISVLSVFHIGNIHLRLLTRQAMLLSTDPAHDFELLRMLGLTYRGGADAAEMLWVAGQVRPGDDEGWYRTLRGLADRVRTAGDASLRRGHGRSASESYLRACVYYMFADFYIQSDPADPRIVELGRLSRQCLMDARDLDYHIDKVDIPLKDVAIPAYVVTKKGLKPRRRHTLICHNGFDGTKEEAALWPGMAAADRGYVVIVFDGPGQGEMVREHGRHFRPDWQVAVTPVVDYALTRDDVDPAKLALMGISFGGVLAPMAAQHEHRFAALIANGGVIDFGEALAAVFPPLRELGDAQYQEQVDAICRTDANLRWVLHHGKYVFGAANAAELVRMGRQYRVTHPERIRCNTLVIDSEHEQYFAGQPERLATALNCRHTLMKFQGADHVGTHYQAGGEAAGGRLIFDWLDEALDVKPD